jgi:polyphosphate kinase 2 (PPK2 family)
MRRKDILDAMRKYTDPFRVTKGKDFRLKDFDPGDTLGLKMDKAEAAELLERGSDWLAMEQNVLYAQDSWSVLLVFQAMDAAGKDGTIKHVMSRVNPQGCEVYSFKQPSDEELSHDFLWRYATKVPERGRIGIFNRSYYEEVLVVRVHQALLKAQKMPPKLVGKGVWDERLADIARFEDYLARQGVAVLKFYLNLSRKEQRSASWSGSTSRTRTGNSPPPTCANAATGTITCRPTRRLFGRRRRKTRPGSWSRPTTSGSPAWWSRRRSSRPSRSSTSPIRRSRRNRRRTSPPRAPSFWRKSRQGKIHRSQSGLSSPRIEASIASTAAFAASTARASFPLTTIWFMNRPSLNDG